MANRFGCRIVSIVGSIIAGVFFAISQFSPNIDVLIFTYGVMGGELLTLFVKPCFLADIVFYHQPNFYRSEGSITLTINYYDCGYEYVFIVVI